MRNCSLVFVVPMILAGPLTPAFAAKTTKAKSPAEPLQMSLTDVGGGVHHLRQREIKKALVLVFISTECPIANSYVPTLNDLHDKYAKPRPGSRIRENSAVASPKLQNSHEFCYAKPRSGVRFYSVTSDSSVTRAAAVKHSKEYRVRFPVLFDASGELATYLKPTHTPEAFVLNADGKIVYRGRIDDAWADLGKRRPKVTDHTLADAIAATIAGKPVKAARTKPVGCFFESVSPLVNKEAAVTYSRDIAPIVHAACVRCHRDGEVAPFPLTSYRDVAKRAKQIAHVTQTRFMPPWKPKAGFGHFRNERRITKQEIALIAKWAAAGAPEGDPRDLPPLPKFKTGWQLGQPDLVLKMPQAFNVPADGPDLFRNFVLPLNNDAAKFCVAAEFHPGNRRVVHHSVFFLDTSRIARLRDSLDPKPGYGSFGGPGFVPAGDVGGWAPGYEPHRLPNGQARYVPPRSDLVLQIHYHPSGKPEQDQSEIGLYFTKKPRRIAANITVGKIGFTIPAGAKRHRMSASYELPSPITLLAVTPHMHLLGREMKVTATLPNGKVQPLIWVDDWDFNWQDQYFLDHPLRLPKGTRLTVEARYDNSSHNPLNPHRPPKDVRFGDGTTDEMLFCFFLVSKDNPRELLPLVIHNSLPIGAAMLSHYLGKAGRAMVKSAKNR